MMITPPYLKSGDRVALVAPAGKIGTEVVRAAMRTLGEWGYEVVPGRHVFDNLFQYAASDPDRLSDLQQALDDPDAKAVLCARGGYGTVRIIDRIDFGAFRNKPKWIIGFSDITVLHAHINRHLGVETLHATMAAGLAGEGPAGETLRAALAGDKLVYRMESHALSREGNATGQLVGGNLAILAGLTATASDMTTEGKVLFIEEVGEHLYRIDRMMWTLKRAGKLDRLAGLIVGGMTDIPDEAGEFGKDAYGIIEEHIRDRKYPVCFGFPAGHQADNRAMILGRTVSLEVGGTSCVTF